MTLQAIIFGSIGTLTETSELQRRAFNAAFAEAGLGWHWDAETYGRLVADGGSGGAARITDFAADRGTPLPAAEATQLHARKSALFQELMASEGLQPNPGVVELLHEARSLGIGLAMASTTSAANIDAMFAATAPALTRDMFDIVYSAETVARGKPAPDVYLATLDHLGVPAAAAVAIEDTRQSLAAPLAAGITTLVVPGSVARTQDFGDAPVAASVAEVGGVAGFARLLAPVTA